MDRITTSCTAARPEHDIGLYGDIDLSSQPDLVSAVRLLMRCAHADVCVDAGPLNFIDSTGLTFLAHLARVSHERGGRVRVTGAPRQLARLVEVTALPLEMDQSPDASCGVTAGGQG